MTRLTFALGAASCVTIVWMAWMIISVLATEVAHTAIHFSTYTEAIWIVGICQWIGLAVFFAVTYKPKT